MERAQSKKLKTLSGHTRLDSATSMQRCAAWYSVAFAASGESQLGLWSSVGIERRWAYSTARLQK